MNNITLWDGNFNTLQSTVINNWNFINNIINQFNNSKSIGSTLVPIDQTLSTNKYDTLNGEFWNEYISNIKIANNIVITLYSQLNSPFFIHDNFNLSPLFVPSSLSLDPGTVNQYWQVLKDNFDFIINTINENKIF